jgi:hypothetical protein
MTGATTRSSTNEVPLWRVRLADLRGRGIYAGAPDAHRCIFIHIPKTAGSSVAEALFNMPSRHVTYTEYLRASPRKFRTYFKFAFVRNPWDRLVSTWFFLRKGGMNEPDRAWSEKRLSAYVDFDSFVREGLGRPEVLSWVHFRPQADFILAPDGTVMVDFVGRYERLAEDFSIIARRLGTEALLPTHNSSDHAPFASYYTPESASIVARVYARDVRAFGYQPPVIEPSRA